MPLHASSIALEAQLCITQQKFSFGLWLHHISCICAAYPVQYSSSLHFPAKQMEMRCHCIFCWLRRIFLCVEWGAFTQMNTLDIAYCPALSGPVPADWFDAPLLTTLETLHLQGNKLTGQFTVPVSPGRHAGCWVPCLHQGSPSLQLYSSLAYHAWGFILPSMPDSESPCTT